jgi:hypothetical protein
MRFTTRFIRHSRNTNSPADTARFRTPTIIIAVIIMLSSLAIQSHQQTRNQTGRAVTKRTRPPTECAATHPRKCIAENSGSEIRPSMPAATPTTTPMHRNTEKRSLNSLLRKRTGMFLLPYIFIPPFRIVMVYMDIIIQIYLNVKENL